MRFAALTVVGLSTVGGYVPMQHGRVQYAGNQLRQGYNGQQQYFNRQPQAAVVNVARPASPGPGRGISPLLLNRPKSPAIQHNQAQVPPPPPPRRGFKIVAIDEPRKPVQAITESMSSIFPSLLDAGIPSTFSWPLYQSITKAKEIFKTQRQLEYTSVLTFHKAGRDYVLPGNKANSEFTTVSKIAEGSACIVAAARDLLGHSVAIKFSNENIEQEREWVIMSLLRTQPGFLRPIFLSPVYSEMPFRPYNSEAGYSQYMVMSEMGQTLYDVNDTNSFIHRFTVASIGLQAIERLDALHSAGFVHNDIHLGNLGFGKGDQSTLYLFDFGLARTFVNSTGEHIKNTVVGINPNRNKIHLSPSQLSGMQVSRRDDLQRLSVILMYIYEWKKCRWNFAYDSQHNVNTPSEEVCDWAHPKLKALLRYTRGLQFDQKPDYGFMKGLLHDIIQGDSELRGWKYNGNVIWPQRQEQRRLMAV